MRFNEEKEETQEIKFNAEEFVDEDTEPGFTTDVEDQEKVDKAFNKEMDKVVKFENFVTINVDNIENVELEIEHEGGEEESLDEEPSNETSGCGCCEECTGEPGCVCGCPDCTCEPAAESEGTEDVVSFADFVGDEPESSEDEENEIEE